MQFCGPSVPRRWACRLIRHSVGVGCEMISSASVLIGPLLPLTAAFLSSAPFAELPLRPPALARKEPRELNEGKREDVRL